MDDTYLNVKIFLSRKTLLVPVSIDEFIKLYNKAAPENVFRAEKLVDPVFQDYTISFSEETDKLKKYTCYYDKEADKKVSGVFIFQFKDMHIAYPDRFFLTIEEMIDGNKFKIDHGKVYHSFKEGNAPDVETFIKFKDLGYKNIKDYETSQKENTAQYFTEITKLAHSLPQNINDKYFNTSLPDTSDKILKESHLFYYKEKTGNPSYEQIIETFKLGYDDFETYRTAKRYGNLSSAEFHEFRKHIESFNTYETFLKGKKNSIWSESGVMLFDKLGIIRDKNDYSNMVESLIHYILETYIFEKMSREAFTNKIRSLVCDILNKYGMLDNQDLKDYNSLLEPAIESLENRKTLFEYSQSTGVIRIMK